jgi:hypothetical protein
MPWAVRDHVGLHCGRQDSSISAPSKCRALIEEAIRAKFDCYGAVHGRAGAPIAPAAR